MSAVRALLPASLSKRDGSEWSGCQLRRGLQLADVALLRAGLQQLPLSLGPLLPHVLTACREHPAAVCEAWSDMGFAQDPPLNTVSAAKKSPLTESLT